jgi:hypothetical protein
MRMLTNSHERAMRLLPPLWAAVVREGLETFLVAGDQADGGALASELAHRRAAHSRRRARDDDPLSP